MNFLVECSNDKCKRELLVEKVDASASVVFKKTSSIVQCPLCGTKTLVTVNVSKLGGQDESTKG